MNKGFFRVSLLLGASALTVASCSDYEPGDVESEVKQENYKSSFEDLIDGNVNAAQDWSAAATIQANVSVSGASSAARVAIYTERPILAAAKVLAVQTGTSFSFNAPKSMEQVYVTVTEGDETLAEGFYNITNGAVAITDTPVAQKARATRANACPVTIAGTQETVLKAYGQIWMGYTSSNGVFATGATEQDCINAAFQYIAKKLGKTVDEVKASEQLYRSYGIRYNSTTGSYYANGTTMKAITTNTVWVAIHGGTIYALAETKEQCVSAAINYLNANYTIGADGYDQATVYSWYGITTNADGSYNCSEISEQPIIFDTRFQTLDIDFTYLSGVEKTDAPSYTMAQCHELFGPKKFFNEQNYYYGLNGKTFDKTTLYGDDVIGTIQKLEKGFSIKSTGGEIEIPFIYGATEHFNQLGYVIYDEGKDPLTYPHYILFQDAAPQHNIKVNGAYVGAMSLASWNDYYTEGSDEVYSYSYPNNSTIVGSSCKLVYFDESGNASYTIPAGKNIVFFIAHAQSEADLAKTDGTAAYYEWNINYSLPELNYRLCHLYYNTASPTFETGNDSNSSLKARGAVKAAAWEYNGMTFFGFEDGGADEDLNDIVFWVEGAYQNANSVVKLEDDGSLVQPYEWMFACEDLGDTYDYDFNDVVWSITKDYNESTIAVNLLAAGGIISTELYYGDKLLGNVHGAFNQRVGQNGYYAQVNVGTGVTKESVELESPDDIDVNTDVNTIYNNFKVKVTNSANESYFVTSPSNTGSNAAPQIILLPEGWCWPKEGVAITTAYPGFSNWATSAEWADWSQTMVADKVVTR